MDIEDTVCKINASLAKNFMTTDNGDRKPIVCVVCDQFIAPANMKIISKDYIIEKSGLLLANRVDKIDLQLEKEYKIMQSIYLSSVDRRKLSRCLLSPRAEYMYYSDKRKTSGFPVCCTCFASLAKHKTPQYCIANNYAIGCTPPCLQ
jgi:hypothetical protein